MMAHVSDFLFKMNYLWTFSLYSNIVNFLKNKKPHLKPHKDKSGWSMLSGFVVEDGKSNFCESFRV